MTNSSQVTSSSPAAGLNVAPSSSAAVQATRTSAIQISSRSTQFVSRYSSSPVTQSLQSPQPVNGGASSPAEPIPNSSLDQTTADEIISLVYAGGETPLESLGTTLMKQSGEQQEKLILGLRMNILAVIAGALLAVLVMAFVACCVLRSKKRKVDRVSLSVSKSVTAEELTTSDPSSDATITAGTSSMMGTATLVPGEKGLAIPVFFECNFGIDVRVSQPIAKGGFSTVSIGQPLKASLRGHGDQVIFKQLTNIEDKDKEKVLKTFYQEIAIMAYLGDHPNIAKILGYCQNPPSLIMKFYPYGSLSQYLDNRENRLSKRGVIYFGLDISRGLAHMHSNGICHADIKPQNILLEQIQGGRISLVLTDFGIAQVFNAKTLVVGAFLPVALNALSIRYAAPEAIVRLRTITPLPSDQMQYLDVYSYGITFYEILCREQL